MIQTQLLRLDPPYQIISARGQVGIQVATLIVTENKTTEDGKYAIDTHSHPVVNYGLKQGVSEELKYNTDPNPDTQYKITLRLQPEGAVWNKVEVNEVRVLGLAGAQNEAIDLFNFVLLVPSDPEFSPGERVWNKYSTNRIYDLRSGLEKVGLKLMRNNTGFLPFDNGDLTIKLKLTFAGSNATPVVQVVIKEEEENPAYESDLAIDFNVRLFDENDSTDDKDKIVSTITCETIIMSPL